VRAHDALVQLQTRNGSQHRPARATPRKSVGSSTKEKGSIPCFIFNARSCFDCSRHPICGLQVHTCVVPTLCCALISSSHERTHFPPKIIQIHGNLILGALKLSRACLFCAEATQEPSCTVVLRGLQPCSHEAQTGQKTAIGGFEI
jgi:hypothetical protein